MRQRYVSDELTHFVGRGLSKKSERYDLLRTIIKTGELKSNLGFSMSFNPHAALSSQERFQISAVCFCDIPMQDLSIHMNKYSRFGLSFRKSFLTSRYGASPVFYVPGTVPVMDVSAQLLGYSTRGSLFDAVMDKLHVALQEHQKRLEELHPPTPVDPVRFGKPTVTNIVDGKSVTDVTGNAVYVAPQVTEMTIFMNYLYTHVFSYIKPFDHALREDHPENTYMEREWRVLGQVKFQLSDIERLIVPRQYARIIRKDFPDYYGQVSLV